MATVVYSLPSPLCVSLMTNSVCLPVWLALYLRLFVSSHPSSSQATDASLDISSRSRGERLLSFTHAFLKLLIDLKGRPVDRLIFSILPNHPHTLSPQFCNMNFFCEIRFILLCFKCTCAHSLVSPAKAVSVDTGSLPLSLHPNGLVNVHPLGYSLVSRMTKPSSWLPGRSVHFPPLLQPHRFACIAFNPFREVGSSMNELSESSIMES